MGVLITITLVAPYLRNRLYSFTYSGTQHIAPQQKKFLPQPVHVHIEQHAGFVISAGLQAQHPIQQRLILQPAQHSPQKFHQQQSHTTHWHIFCDGYPIRLLNISNYTPIMDELLYILLLIYINILHCEDIFERLKY